VTCFSTAFLWGHWLLVSESREKLDSRASVNLSKNHLEKHRLHKMDLRLILVRWIWLIAIGYRITSLTDQIGDS